MRQRCAVTEQSDYIIFPQDRARNIFCDYGAWTGQEAAAFYATRMWKHRYKMINDNWWSRKLHKWHNSKNSILLLCRILNHEIFHPTLTKKSELWWTQSILMRHRVQCECVPYNDYYTLLSWIMAFNWSIRQIFNILQNSKWPSTNSEPSR